MNEEAENTVLDTSGDDPASVVDRVPVDASPAVTAETEPDPEPEAPAQSIEVISVDEMLDRLAAGEESADAAEEDAEPAEDVVEDESVSEEPAIETDSGAALELLEAVQQDVDHPFLTTDFADYTVTEGLLLMVLLLAVISLCVKMLKEGFSWL